MNDYQIIDSDDYLAAGIETMVFPGGEPHLKFHKPIDKDILLFLKLRNWLDTGYAALLIEALPEATVFIPYFPGARQDRRDNNPGVFTARVMYYVLVKKNYGFTKHLENRIWTFDPHSHYIGDKTVPLMPSNLITESPIASYVKGIIAPDVGASKRAENFRSKLYPQAELIQCYKRRDSMTGKLSGYQMPPLPQEGSYIIVDDICDGGGTFNLLAEEFKKDPLSKYSNLSLFVSHGIFSKGIDAIDPVISKIITTDSWCKLGNRDRLKVIPLAPLFDKIMGEVSL